MQFFINELSLHNQFYTANDFEKAVKEFSELFSCINEQIQAKKLYKEAVLMSRATFLSKPFTAAFEQIKDRDLKAKFQRTIFNRLNPKDWRKEQVHDIDDLYICPICDENDGLVSDTSLAEATERNLLKSTETNCIIINFKSSRFADYPSISVIKNDTETVDLAHFDSKGDFEKWFTTTFVELKDTFLRNENTFIRTKYKQQGATVFQEKATGNYWYIDNLHKDHFEVFDTQLKHLGTADMYGNIGKNTKIKGRTMDLSVKS